jgi:hypothetical protein
MAIRKVQTKKLGIRYAVRVHVGNGKYEMLGTFPTKAAAREHEAAWLVKTRGRARKTGSEWADFYLEGYAGRV